PGDVVGVAAAILAPVTGGTSGLLIGALVVTAATAATDFGFSVLGQAIDQGGFDNIDWAGAGINAAIGTGVSLLTLGASRLVAAPRLLGLHSKAVAFFTNPSKWKALRSAPSTDLGGAVSWNQIKSRGVDMKTGKGKLRAFWGRILWSAERRRDVLPVRGGFADPSGGYSLGDIAGILQNPSMRGSIGVESVVQPQFASQEVASVTRTVSVEVKAEKVLYSKSVSSEISDTGTLNQYIRDFEGNQSFLENFYERTLPKN
ncbi:MAG: hypothetical protein WCG96_05075, partial [Actinomycetes bacterium]